MLYSKKISLYIVQYLTRHMHNITGRGGSGGRGRGGARPVKTGAIQDFKGSKMTFDDSD